MLETVERYPFRLALLFKYFSEFVVCFYTFRKRFSYVVTNLPLVFCLFLVGHLNQLLLCPQFYQFIS